MAAAERVSDMVATSCTLVHDAAFAEHQEQCERVQQVAVRADAELQLDLACDLLGRPQRAATHRIQEDGAHKGRRCQDPAGGCQGAMDSKDLQVIDPIRLVIILLTIF